ncbi:hypothetical protein B296_00059253, partial [Ensete ventricosum]
ALSRKFKILAIPDVLAHGKSYKHGHKLCAKSRSVEFRSVFHTPSRKFKILIIPDVLAHGKLYEYDFMKKHEVIKFVRKSSFDQFFVHRLENSKYWPFPMY